jgi:hypothetical protein
VSSEYVSGAVCEFRKPKPGERLERSWTTVFPVTLDRPFIIEGYWWVEDARGRRVWIKETDLVVIRQPAITPAQPAS